MAKKNQASLFEEAFPKNEESIGKEIVIVAKENRPLSKEQDRFNKITIRIKKLEKKLVSMEKSFERLLNYYNEKVESLILEEAKLKISAAFMVDKKINSLKKPAKYLLEKSSDLVSVLLEDGFVHLEPNKEEEALFDRYFDVSYQEEKSIQIEEMKRGASSMFSEMFGMDIDLDDLDIENEEDIARWQRELQEKLGNQFDEKGKGKEKPKTKKQIEKELMEEAKFKMQAKSLKSVYLSLTKVLHPDKELDTVLKLEKEELMKKVTAAYQAKDFPTLLQLEMEWLSNKDGELSNLNDDTLKIYNELLIDREKQLKSDEFMMKRNPRFHTIEPLLNFQEKKAFKEIDNTRFQLKKDINVFKSNLTVFESLKSKSDIGDFINDFHIDIVHSRYDEDDFFDFLEFMNAKM